MNTAHHTPPARVGGPPPRRVTVLDLAPGLAYCSRHSRYYRGTCCPLERATLHITPSREQS